MTWATDAGVKHALNLDREDHVDGDKFSHCSSRVPVGAPTEEVPDGEVPAGACLECVEDLGL